MAISNKTLWLGVATCVFVILAGQSLLEIFVLSLPLLCGAVILRRFPRAGEWLFVGGAVWLTVAEILLALPEFFAGRVGWGPSPAKAVARVISVALLIALDFAVVKWAVGGRSEPRWVRTLHVSESVRWLAGITSVVVIILTTFEVGWISLITAQLLIGAIIVGRRPYWGKTLLMASAVFTSLWAIPVGVGVILEGTGAGNGVGLGAAVVVSMLCACDLALASAISRGTQTQ